MERSGDVWGGEDYGEWLFFALCIGAHFPALFPGFVDFVFGGVVVVFFHVVFLWVDCRDVFCECNLVWLWFFGIIVLWACFFVGGVV